MARHFLNTVPFDYLGECDVSTQPVLGPALQQRPESSSDVVAFSEQLHFYASSLDQISLPPNSTTSHRRSLTQPVSLLQEPQMGRQDYHHTHNVEEIDDDGLPFFTESSAGQSSKTEAGSSQNPRNCMVGNQPMNAGGQRESRPMPGHSNQQLLGYYNELPQTSLVASYDSYEVSSSTTTGLLEHENQRNTNNYMVGYQPVSVEGQSEWQPIAGTSQYPSQQLSGYSEPLQSFPHISDAPSSRAVTGLLDYEKNQYLPQGSEGHFEAKAPPVAPYADFIDTLVGGQVARNVLKSHTCYSVDDLSQNLDEVVAQTPLDAPEEIHEEVRRTRDTAKTWVKKLQTEYPDKRVKAISFSDITYKDYLPLGVDCSPAPIPKILANVRVMGLILDKIKSQKPSRKGNDDLRTAGKGKAANGSGKASKGKAMKGKATKGSSGAAERPSEFTLQDALEAFSTSNKLVLKINETNSSSDDEPEAFARLIIDLFLAEMTAYLVKMELGVFRAPEFRIASDPVEVLNGVFLTVLTGSVDYALFSKQELSDSSLTALRSFWVSHKKKGVKAILVNAPVLGIHILMIEAKKKKYFKSLHSCMPQVAAECIAAMKTSGVTDMRWCLSTGSSWLFGVICREKWAKGEYRMYTIEAMEYDINALNDSANVSVVHNIFWTLMCWSMLSVSEIIKAVFKDVKSYGC